MSEGAIGSGRERAARRGDAGVIEALRRGDERAFARLVDAYHASLGRVAGLYVSNRAVADEVVQDTWLGVIQGIRGFQGRSSLKTWIFRILVNLAKTRAVREARVRPFAHLSAEAEPPAAADDRSRPARDPAEAGRWIDPPPDLAASPEGRLLTRETREQLDNAIAALHANQRRVLILRDVDGCSTEEVGHALGLQETNVRVLLHRARANVRAALEPYLGRA